MLDIWPSRGLGEPAKARQRCDIGHSHLSFTIDSGRGLTLLRSDGHKPCLPRRCRIPSHPSHADIFPIGPLDRRDSESILWQWLCRLTISNRTMRLCGHAIIPCESAQPPPHTINASPIRPQPPNHQTDLWRMSSVLSMRKMRQG